MVLILFDYIRYLVHFAETRSMVDEVKQRDIILSAARDLFSRFGLEKTTMEDIARAAGKGKSSLYYYFKSKEEVFAQVIGREIAGLKTAISSALASREDPPEKLRIFVRVRLRYLRDKANQYTTVREDYLKNYRFIHTLTADYSTWEMRTLREIVREGRDRGLFNVTDLDATSRAIFFALKSLEYPWAEDLEREDAERSIDVLMDILLRGISGR